ncbi:MAG: alpha/beta fold hydrolase [Gammaproteobacteria bacterium]|jgi:putative redox protein
MHRETIEFRNDADIALNGILHHAVGDTRALAVFAHCFTCTARSKAAVTICRQLARLGIATLRFDFTGLGESEGEFAQSNFSTSVADIQSAVAELERRFDTPVELLIGHSLGGTAVLTAAGRLPQVRAVATLGAPARPEHISKLIHRSTVATSDDVLEVDLGGRPFTIGRQLFDDLAAHSQPERFAELRAAILVMHAPLDGIVEIANASEIFLHAKHPKSFVSLDDADHLLSREADAEYAARVISTWSRRYLIAAESSAPAEDEREGPDATAVTRGGSFLTAIDVGGHALIADEPASVGGENLGPAPTKLLSAALAACTCMTLQMYARHKGLPLERVSAEIRHSKQTRETGDGKETISTFDRVVELSGELDAAQRTRLIEIAERCPVHRALTGKVHINTREA